MKKLTLLLVGIIFSLSAFSQFSLESSSVLLRANDTIIKQCVEYRDPGRSGPDVLWNFSELDLLDDAYTISYGQIGDSLTGTEHRTTYYYGVSGDSLFFHGYEKNTTWMKYVRSELLLKYPVHYGDSLQSYYQGLGKYCTDLSLDVMGVTDVKADAYGLMVLPGGDTLRHVLRVRSFKRMAEGSDILNLRRFERSLLSPLLSVDSIAYHLSNDSVILEIETFRWYALGYRYPVFETVRGATVKNGESKDFFAFSFFYPPQEHTYLNDDTVNLALLSAEEERSKAENKSMFHDNNDRPGKVLLNYNVYWETSGDAVRLDYQLNSNAEISIYLYDMQGRTRMVCPMETYSNGFYSRKLDFSEMDSGQYLLLMVMNGERYTEKIIK